MRQPFKKKIRVKKLLLIAAALSFFCITALINVVFANAAETVNAATASASGESAPLSFWLWRFLGRLHPLMVHFPVGLVVFAALLELFTIKHFSSKLRPGINALVLAGVIASAVSVVFGLLLAEDGEYGEELLSLHQWTGIATLLLVLLSWSRLRAANKKPIPPTITAYRSFLFLGALGIAVAGHFGASLTHGKDYLSSALPSRSSEEMVANDPALAALVSSNTDQLTPQQEAQLNIQVRAILAHNCYQCHGEEKIKGELRLDSKERLFKGGEHGSVIVAGKPSESELYRRITLPAGHKEAMPSKGKSLSKEDIAVIGFWIKKGAPWPDGIEQQRLFKVAELAPRNPPLPPETGGLNNPVDRFLNQYFAQHNIAWPSLVDDRIFIRRVYLDIIGLLPTPEEFNSFMGDQRADKRAALVKELLNRNDQYATHWITFWNDALRNDYTGTGYITKGRFNITDWLYNSIKSNKPYDQFTQELVSPTDVSKGFIEGIRWRGAVNASQTTEMQAAQNVAQVFLGLNLKCASCHNSFISDWKLTDAYAFANIFADSSLEINRCDKPTGKFTSPAMLWRQLGSIDSAAPRNVKMAQLAVNMTKPENGRYYRTIVNRIWAQLMGRGLVEPVDVMDNDPWNQDLLDWLAYDFEKNGKDIKKLISLIATSQAYQLPSVGFKAPADIMNQGYVFNGVVRKRMTAEQFADAAGLVIGPVFPDSIMMYRPVYDTASLSRPSIFARASLVANNPFLTALGRPNRENVSTSRESQANLLQALELTNGERFNAAMKRGAANWKKQYSKPEDIVNKLYLRALGRAPQQHEFAAAKKLLGAEPSVDAIQDLFWVVLLLPEFQIIY